jgi:hypothetical protein
MENAPVIAGLLSTRASIEREIAELERDIRRHRSEMMQIDATILLFAPTLTRAKRDITRFQRSAHFMVGELTWRCQTAFREAKGQTVTVDEIAVQAMRDKNLDMGDGALRQDVTRRFMWAPTWMLKPGTVVKQGYGADARWVMPLTIRSPFGSTVTEWSGRGFAYGCSPDGNRAYFPSVGQAHPPTVRLFGRWGASSI